METKGIEPSTPGLQSRGDSTEGVEIQEVASHPAIERTAGRTSDVHLERVIQAWEMVPESIKHAILTLIAASE